ncbi:reverse transcriptase domain-containing protein [Tanacetum coccineum]
MLYSVCVSDGSLNLCLSALDLLMDTNKKARFNQQPNTLPSQPEFSDVTEFVKEGPSGSSDDTSVDTMEDTRTMSELLQAPTEGYGDVIVIPAILAENFELKVGLLTLNHSTLKLTESFHMKLQVDACVPFSLVEIPIDLQDQENITFTCSYGAFSYRRMPFGLCNAPGTFQRCMMAIFHDMIEETIEVFMDDFSVFGDSFSSCLSHLDEMLKMCEDTNLVLNWEKCHFMVKKGIVLGHKISKSGIEVDKAKIDVIAKLPIPLPLSFPSLFKGVRSFLVAVVLGQHCVGKAYHCFDLGGGEIDADILPDFKDDYYNSKGDIIYLESLLINDTIPYLPPEVFLDRDPKSLNDEPNIDDLKIKENVRFTFEDRHYLSLTFVIQIFLSFLTYLVNSLLLLSSENEDNIFDPDIPAYSFYSLEPMAYE